MTAVANNTDRNGNEGWLLDVVMRRNERQSQCTSDFQNWDWNYQHFSASFFLSIILLLITELDEKALGETQTLRAGRSNVEPKIFAPPQTPFPGVQDCQNLISWRWSLPAPTDPVWWRSMHAISSYPGNRHRPPQTHKHTDRTDYNTLRR